MLRNLHIKNMALIDEIEVNFEEGLNILTGETGAGKSIILGAVNIALGGRTGKEMLREGAEYGLVELLFEINTPETKEALTQIDISLSEDNVLIISRRIYPNRVVNKVNDEMVTVSKLKEIAGVLIDIHSQQEHQSLLKKSNHLNILDRFGHDKIETIKKLVRGDYEVYVKQKEELDAMQMDEETRNRQISFLKFEIQEIEEAALQPEEEEKLEARYRRMTNSRKIMESVSHIYQSTGYEQSESAGNQIGHAFAMISKSAEYDDTLLNLQEQLGTIDSLLNDFNRELSDYISELTFDEQEFRQVEQRLDQIHNLEAKYGKTIPLVLEYMEEKQKEYARYEDYEVCREQLQKECTHALEQYKLHSETLSQVRKQVAEQLTQMISNALMDLNFLDVRFDMKFKELEQPTGNGMEEAYFVISTNIGEEMKPLWEVASGGELSRIMLAVKSCLAEVDDIDTLIFDEIDVGISGRTAQKVSEKLSALGRQHQVICISHLPQIAAMADAHYKIEKQVQGEKTVTQIYPLEEEASVEEIARMLGGVEITETVLSSAAEMKEMAKRTKIY
ncbi:MAG: DNA repair protein RecN [Lachnospiraceae bacterium]|nr:DNA repair protein RecN [Lachnospiraceae bacterium]